MTSFIRKTIGTLIFGLAVCATAGTAHAQSAPADTDPPGSIPVYPPAPGTGMPPARPNGATDSVPELLHYRFDGTGVSVPNLASSPPPGTATATIMGGLTQTGANLNLSGGGFSLRGSGVSSNTDYLNTGWATSLTGSWTISFVSAEFNGPNTTLYYIFGDSNASSFRCFTNGVAGTNNWILRGPFTDVLVTGAATGAAHRTTFVYDATASAIFAYVDGVLVNTVPQTGAAVLGAGPFKVMGYGTNVGAPAGGLLDDFRVYDRALSAAEVAVIDTGIGNLEISGGGIVAFGDQLVGSSSAAGTVTLSNTGTASLDVTALTDPSAPFARSGGTCSSTLPITLGTGASCTLEYTFSPTVAGASSEVLTVTANAPGSGSITLSGTGTQGNLTITPDSVPFGDQGVGTSSAASSVTLSNTGTGTLDVTALTEPTAPFARVGGSCANTLPITLGAGASCTLDYTFAPTTATASSQVLTVTANAPGSGSITLSGTGVQGSLTITPAAVPFGNQALGTTSAASSVTLSNTGSASLDVTSLTAAAAPFARVGGSCANTLPITLGAGASCTLDYTFAPTTATASSQVLTVTANAPGSGSITLSGTGVQGSLTITPAAVPFGDQAVGTTSAANSVTLSNTGSASLDVTALTAAAAPFSRVGGSCSNTLPITLGAGASCTLGYTFAPTSATASSQVLTVTANAPGSGSITLSGRGIEGNLGVLDSSLDFGVVTIPGSSSATLTLVNSGNGALVITGLTDPQAPFSVTGGTCGALPITLEAGASCTVVYRFAPTVQQQAAQTITITSNFGSTTVTLRGVALSAVAIPASSGSGLALLLLLLMGVAMVRLRGH